MHRRPVAAQNIVPVCHSLAKQSKRNVKVSARVLAENPTAPEVKSGQKVSTAFALLVSARANVVWDFRQSLW